MKDLKVFSKIIMYLHVYNTVQYSMTDLIMVHVIFSVEVLWTEQLYGLVQQTIQEIPRLMLQEWNMQLSQEHHCD